MPSARGESQYTNTCRAVQADRERGARRFAAEALHRPVAFEPEDGPPRLYGITARIKKPGEGARKLFFYEFFHQEGSQPAGIVTHHAMNFEEIIEDALEAHSLQCGGVNQDGLGTL